MKLKTALMITAGIIGSIQPAAAAERVKFNFWHGLTGALAGVLEQQCTNFNESQDKFEAVCTSQGAYDMAEQNTVAAYRAGEHPALVQIYEVGTVNFMLSGAVYPAHKFAADHGLEIDWADYLPGISNYYADSTGNMWSFPYNSSTPVFYWDKAAWTKIGKDKAPQTWDELGADLEAMKAAGVECGLAFDTDAWMLLEQFQAANNLPLATLSNGFGGLGAEVVFDQTPFVAHMQRLKDWSDKGYARLQTTHTGKTLVQSFADGTCASMVHTIGQHGVVKTTQAEGLDWDVALMPVLDAAKRTNTIVGGASLWVLNGKETAEYEAVAAFIDYVTDYETGEKFLVENTGYIPVTTSAYEQLKADGFYDNPQFKGREVAIESLQASDVTENSKGYRLGNHIAIRGEIRAAVEAFMSGSKPVDVAVKEAAARSNDMLRRFERTYRGVPLP